MELKSTLTLAAITLSSAWSAHAANLNITATVQSLVPSNSVAFAPLRLGFNSGTFDAFDIGSAATAAIRTLAESGSGADWFPAFNAADPTAVTGTVGGVLLPGMSASNSFTVDTDTNPYFTFAAMVVPSNDFFIGNDSPTAYKLFDNSGNLSISTITIKARDIWDAGSEVFDPAAAAFVGDASLRTDQNSVVAKNFAEFAAYNGLTTAAGYTFDSQLTADSEVYRISFAATPVPVPAALPMFAGALGCLGVLARRRVVK